MFKCILPLMIKETANFAQVRFRYAKFPSNLSEIIYPILFLTIIFALTTKAFATPINLPRDSQGWTLFTPSVDSRIVYISATGNDSTGTFYTPDSTEIAGTPLTPTSEIQPFATFSAAYEQTRSGYPDWILFKRGDEFEFSISITKSGRSEVEPFVLGAYGESGAVPVIKHGTSTGVSIYRASSRGGSINYVTLSSLNFYAHSRDPGNNDFETTNASTNINIQSWGSTNHISSILIEGCSFSWSSGNTIMAGNGSTTKDIIIRRNKFLSNYPASSGHTQGLYSQEVDGFIIEENIFDHNGWYYTSAEGGFGVGTIYNHNTYFVDTSNVTIRNNIFLRGSNMNNKFTSPSGAVKNITIDGNLYVGGHIGIGIGTNYTAENRFTNINIKNNVMTNLGMKNVTGQGIAWFLQISGWAYGTVSRNLLMNQVGEIYGWSACFNVHDDAYNVNISENVIYNIQDSTTYILLANNSTASYDFTNNKIWIPSGSPIYTNIGGGTHTFSNNQWFSSTGSSTGWIYNGFNSSFSNFLSSTNDISSTYSPISFPDYTRSLETYMQSIGEFNDIEIFISRCRNQDRFNWDSRFTAEKVNEWIRNGFWGLRIPLGFRVLL